MNELIKITENNGKKAVSARDLYEFLELNPTNIGSWFDSNIKNNLYAEEGIDYQQIVSEYDLPNNAKGKKMDYALTLDFAKKLSMTTKSAKGNEIRDYFINDENNSQIIQI